MALATATITFDLSDMLGVDFDPRRTKVWIDTNIANDTVIDTDGNQIRLGSGNVTLAADGTGTFTTWVPGVGSNPETWQTSVHVDYADRNQPRGRVSRTFGPYTITASANLADLEDEQAVPPTYLTTVTELLDGYVDSASASATSAAASAVLADSYIVADLNTSDGQMEALIESPSSLTSGALSATYAAHPTGMPIDTDDPTALIRLDNITGPVAKRVMQIRQNHSDYALKIDHYGDGDAVNIVSHNTTDPTYTVVGINGENTDLGTLKVVNNAAQTGGAVIAGWGTDPTRTAPIFIADNWGLGNGFQSYHRAGSEAVAFRAAYDAADTFTERAIWIPARHTAGAIIFVENPVAQTAGAMLSLHANNAGTTAPLVQLTNDGTGYLIDATNDGFAVDGSGYVRTAQLFNISSFNNSKIQLATTGTQIIRNVGDTGTVLQVKQDHASGTGDLLSVQITGSAIKSRFNKAGTFMTRVNAAPADADLATSEMAIWFDNTNGASKLMVKAKQADGTVKTASVALA